MIDSKNVELSSGRKEVRKARWIRGEKGRKTLFYSPAADRRMRQLSERKLVLQEGRKEGRKEGRGLRRERETTEGQPTFFHFDISHYFVINQS